MAQDAPVSVVITVRNEAATVGDLLASLVGQKGLREVIVVDAQSDDGTVAVVRKSGGDLPRLEILSEPCSRGEGRNMGAERATGDLLAFIDGDCMAASGWTEALADAWGGDPMTVVAGHTGYQGPRRFRKMHRVELAHKGHDTTWPSCNLAYPRVLFEQLGGFDPAFVTAEDIDLNYRALEAGAHIVHEPDAVVTARTRSRTRSFLTQAYWNGYGRKQLTLKHGDLWNHYRFGDMLGKQMRSPWGVARLGAGAAGYLKAKRERGRSK